MKVGVNIVAALVGLMGLVFFLQGIGVLQGSTMSNTTQWTLIGGLMVIVGVVLLVLINRRQARQ